MKLVRNLVLIAILVSTISFGTATTLRVALDGSQPYTVIQEAISASAHGDTVLVYPGRYFENIRFYGKNITLASLELITGDLQYKYSTILDGNQNGSVIQIRNGESAVTIRGLTIINGTGYYDSIYDETYGGGLLIGALSTNNQIRLINCIITHNSADNGGGMQASRCNLFLSGNSIRGNEAQTGGGLKLSASSVTQYSFYFDPVNRCSIYNNRAAFGCDMYFYLVDQVHVVIDTFTVATPSNFYAAAIPLNPDIQNPFTFDILHSVHEEVNHDLYVAPWGDDDNSGLSENSPLKTIFRAVYNIASDPNDPKAVYLAEGLYSKQFNEQFFPLSIKSHISIIGQGIEKTKVDLAYESTILIAPSFSEQIMVSGVRFLNSKGGIYTSQSNEIVINSVDLSNMHHVMSVYGYSGYQNYAQRISNSFISNISSPRMATGIDIGHVSGEVKIINTEISNCSSGEWMPTLQISSINEADVVIDGCRFHDNNSTAPDIWNSIFQIAPFDDVHSQRLGIEISNSAFYNNHQSNTSFMAYARALNDTTYIRNCTFAGNSGGSAALAVLGNAVLENNVFWDPQLQKEVIVYYASDSGTSSNVEFGNNCIRGGQNGIYNMSPLNQIIWHLNNTAADPLFAGAGNAPYRLSAASPLIDAGMDIDFVEPATDAGGNERYYDGNGNGTADIDIGAYEYQPIYAPADLIAEVWQQTIYLSWQMSIPERSLSGYRIYRDNAIYADILDPAQHFFRDYNPVNDTLTYYVVALYGNVESTPSNSQMVIVSGVGNADELAPELIGKISVSPNPFRDLAVISYALGKQAELELKIYNLKGQVVRTLYKDIQSQGEQALAWEGCDDNGRHVASGIYLLQIKFDHKTQRIMKLVKLR